MSGKQNLMSLYEYRECTSSAESRSNAMPTDDLTEASLSIHASSEKSAFVFPSPPDITRHLIENEKPLPRYLLSPHYDKHIPPHIVAYDLIRRQDITTDRLHQLSPSCKPPLSFPSPTLDGDCAHAAISEDSLPPLPAPRQQK